MTFIGPDPITSGVPYDVTAVRGELPATLEQFVGELTFTIAKDGEESLVCGVGRASESGVRFQEKDMDHDGKDVRTWQISRSGDSFSASATALF
jgi:hypothetical protein